MNPTMNTASRLNTSMNTASRQDYYTVPELAARWRCSTDVVYDLLRQGKLHGFKLGASWRISDGARIQYEQTPEREAPQPRRRTPVLKIQ